MYPPHYAILLHFVFDSLSLSLSPLLLPCCEVLACRVKFLDITFVLCFKKMITMCRKKISNILHDCLFCVSRTPSQRVEERSAFVSRNILHDCLFCVSRTPSPCVEERSAFVSRNIVHDCLFCVSRTPSPCVEERSAFVSRHILFTG